jgi:hypothetical protein
MSTLTMDRTVIPTREAAPGIPLTRLVGVELQKMFDTRSGFWLMAGIVAAAVVATGAVVAFAPDEAVTYATFGAAIGVPMAVILPIVAILSVTSEWSQRSGLSTFTMVPHRGRVVAAKAFATLAVGIASMMVAFAVGALGNVLGSAVNGTAAVWDVPASDMVFIVLANVLGMFVGFMLGVLVRSSAGAVVGYFVYSFVLPSVLGVLAATQEWFRDMQPWVDFTYAQGVLFDGAPSAEQWANLATAGSIWLLAPLAAGLVLVLRSEVK